MALSTFLRLILRTQVFNSYVEAPGTNHKASKKQLQRVTMKSSKAGYVIVLASAGIAIRFYEQFRPARALRAKVVEVPPIKDSAT
jgi:hypothetical protein